MSGILGAGVHVPRWRIELTEISKAWGGEKVEGQVSVAGLDEDIFTMAVDAGAQALDNSNIKPSEIGIVCVCTATPSKFPVAARLAFALGANPGVRVMDLGLSVRSTTQALLSCADAVRVGSASCGMVVGVDSMLPEPGSVDEMSWGAAAAAVLVGQDEPAFSIKGVNSYSSAFTERWTVPGIKFQQQTPFPRFARDTGYVDHVWSAGSGLMNQLNLKPEDLKVLVLQESTSADRTAKLLKFPQDRVLRTKSGFAFGDTGCAAVLLGLIESSGKVVPGDLVLLISYGIGGSDAICLIAKKPEKMQTSSAKLAKLRDEKTMIDYPTLLRNRKIIGAPR
jgi:3-hydroxy-3-methylglutaryl CoA synthase